LILHDSEIVIEPGLEVPHPRFRERFFVLGPLAEIAPDMVDPVSRMRVAELLKQLLRDEDR
jgi:2-amino-4-hydroxy-6-hydroxymethyldihydropteridine diphosphokinase